MENKLKVMWIGYGGHSHLAENLRPMIELCDMELICIHEWDSANIRWNLHTWREELKKADIIILPCDYKSFPAKSNNKLTQSMSLGKPVVCSPLAAYKEIERKNPGCCFFADTPEEWKEQLLRLRNSPDLRKEVGQKAIEASREFHIDQIGSKWAKILLKPKTSTDIVIPTYNNLRGLILCIESIRNCTIEPHKIVVVNNGSDEKIDQYLSQQTDIVYIKKDRMNFAQAVNTGIRAGTGDFVMILNDDVIVSKGWLGNLISSCNGNVGVVGPLSNCDYGWLHQISLKIAGVELLPGQNTFEQIEPIVQDICNFKSPYFDCPERDWVAFYCTLIKRDVLNKIGLLNEGFTNSGEDVDLCKRIKKCGYSIIQNYQSFVFHMGAVSRRGLEKEDQESYHEADKKTNDYLRHLWDRKSVVIYSGPMWHRWDFKNVDEGGIGGSETWAVMLARELNNLGYRVTVFADCEGDRLNDGEIEYLNYNLYPKFVEQHWVDYFISSRTTDTFDLPIRAGKKFVQIHDVFLLSDRNKIYLDCVDKFAVLSKWHWDFVKKYHNIPEDKLIMMSNGLDFSRYENKNVERRPHRLFWSSSLDRGIDTLFYLFDFIKKEISDLELHVFYGTMNWELSAKQRGNNEELQKIEEIKRGLNKKGVFYHGRVGQKELAIEQMKSSLWVYPTEFEETFSITSIEAQLAGCPVIASNYAGLQTTVGDSGILIGNGVKGQTYQKEYREEFVTKTIELLTDKSKWKYWSDKGKENANKYSWKNCALKWIKLFEG
jgi:glycosyltransferase involved in cell wall biosynthesis